jgi:hypothetical protein
MANVQKYKKAALGHMFNHYARKTGDNVKRGNEEIKPELTHLNYDLFSGDKGDTRTSDPQKRLEARLAELEHRNLKSYNDNLMCDWVITLPADVPKERTAEFFRNAYAFCCERYGGDNNQNVLSAWVHMDETSPHMHFSFVPAVKTLDHEGKVIKERLCAKEVIDKKELNMFHPALSRYIEQTMGVEYSILTGATDGGNRTITELKLQKTREELDKITLELAEKTTKAVTLENVMPIFENVMDIIQQIGTGFVELDKSLKVKKWFGDDDKAKLEAVKGQVDNMKNCIEQCEGMLNGLQKGTEQIPKEVVKTIKSILEDNNKKMAATENRIKRTENKLKRAMERTAKKEQNVDYEIRKGVEQALEGRRFEIEHKERQSKALDAEIAKKKEQVASLNADLTADFWSKDFLQKGQLRQEQFMEQIKNWGYENESKNAEPAYPKK